MNKKTTIAVFIAIILVGVLIGGGMIGNLFKGDNAEQTSMTQQNQQSVTDLQVKDVVVGTGDTAVAGKKVTVHYTGIFTDGTKFDSSLDRGQPFEFVLGSGMVIKGWDLGVEGMKVGGKRILVIPPQFGYGDKDFGPIKGGSTLIFQVELLGVK